MTKEIAAGQTLKARSACDYDCIFTALVVERKKMFATVIVRGVTKRVKIHNDGYGEFVYAMGKYSMCPMFMAD